MLPSAFGVGRLSLQPRVVPLAGDERYEDILSFDTASHFLWNVCRGVFFSLKYHEAEEGQVV